ncbi:MAG: hypothetical protein QXN83_08495 [Nitrososphaerales archaeon]
MPLLIYDDKCCLCGKFALMARRLSRGNIEIVGHYSEEGILVKNAVFPVGFDAYKMFWLIKVREAFGGRSALIPLSIEIVKGMFKKSRNYDDIKHVCLYDERSCNSTIDFIRRVSTLMKNGKKMKITVVPNP